MSNVARTMAWVLAASLAGVGMAWADDARAADARSSIGVTIRLDDLSGTPARDLDAAKSEMAQIFHAAGVEVDWVDAAAIPRPGQLTLVLLDHNARPAIGGGDIAGEAVRAVARAYVYRDRLDAVTKHTTVDANVVLGRVMAHEIGHLLLAANSHSRVGIMRPHVDFSQVGVNVFTGDQINALHRAIDGVRAEP